MKKIILSVLSLFILSTPVLAKHEKQSCKEGSATQLAQIKLKNGDLIIHGQPDKKQLKHLKETGVKTVVNVRENKELSFNEAAVVKKMGMNYFSIPTTPQTINRDKALQLAKVLDDKNNFPVFLHCHSGNRAALLYAFYRIEKGASSGRALKEAEKLGLTKPELKEMVKMYAKNPNGFNAQKSAGCPCKMCQKGMPDKCVYDKYQKKGCTMESKMGKCEMKGKKCDHDMNKCSHHSKEKEKSCHR